MSHFGLSHAWRWLLLVYPFSLLQYWTVGLLFTNYIFLFGRSTIVMKHLFYIFCREVVTACLLIVWSGPCGTMVIVILPKYVRGGRPSRWREEALIWAKLHLDMNGGAYTKKLSLFPLRCSPSTVRLAFMSYIIIAVITDRFCIQVRAIHSTLAVAERLIYATEILSRRTCIVTVGTVAVDYLFSTRCCDGKAKTVPKPHISIEAVRSVALVLSRLSTVLLISCTTSPTFLLYPMLSFLSPVVPRRALSFSGLWTSLPQAWSLRFLQSHMVVFPLVVISVASTSPTSVLWFRQLQSPRCRRLAESSALGSGRFPCPGIPAVRPCYLASTRWGWLRTIFFHSNFSNWLDH